MSAQNWAGYDTQFAHIYNSKKWRRTRAAYIMAHPLCEVCLSRGITSAAVVVHHVRHLSEDNIGDAEIVYGFGNLMALCGPCHYHHHNSRPKCGGHFDYDADGNVFEPILERTERDGKETEH